MIGVKLQGRLGNQMFQYAFGCVTSWKRKEKNFVTSDSSALHLEYFCLERMPYEKTSNKLKQLLFNLSNFNPKKLSQTGSEETGHILEASFKSDILDGYFQSEIYFRGYENEVKDLFKIKPEYQAAFSKKYKSLFEDHKIIAIHIRRTDYLNWDRGTNYNTNAALPFAYVEGFLKKYRPENHKVLFISDDIAAVKEHFGESPGYSFESNASIIDLQILTNADVLCLSNSSFSWWGAWLNNKPGKKVFAPEYWLGSKSMGEFPKDIICKDWEQLQTEP